MLTGKTIRLNRLMENRRTIIAALDHTRFIGPVDGARTRTELRDYVAKASQTGVKGLLTTPLIFEMCADLVGNMLGFVSVAGGTGPYTLPEPRTNISTSVRHAIQMGADGIYFWAVTHWEHEKDHLSIVSRLAEECRDYGLPLMVEAMTHELFLHSIAKGGKGPGSLNVQDLRAACRVIAELGADIVKTHYPGTVESLRDIVDTCLVPVVIAGGPATRNDEELLQLVADCMEAGAAGFALGRSLFQHASPTTIIGRVKEIVFGGRS